MVRIIVNRMSLQHSLQLSQQCQRHGPGRARGRGHAVGDQAGAEDEERE